MMMMGGGFRYMVMHFAIRGGMEVRETWVIAGRTTHKPFNASNSFSQQHTLRILTHASGVVHLRAQTRLSVD